MNNYDLFIKHVNISKTSLYKVMTGCPNFLANNIFPSLEPQKVEFKSRLNVYGIKTFMGVNDLWCVTMTSIKI